MAEYYFNPPSDELLHPNQRAAIIAPEAIALSGGPGTGKSVVAYLRHLNLSNRGKNSQLLTFTTSLALYLKKCCESKSIIASQNVTTTFKWIFQLPIPLKDEIIIDEAQDLKIVYKRTDERLTWVDNNNGIQFPEVHVYKDFFKSRYQKVSFGADNTQMLRDGIEYKELFSIFNTNHEFHFQKNYRNTKKIMRLAHAAFPDVDISITTINECSREGEYPVLIVTDGNSDIQDYNVLEFIAPWADEKGHNIGVLCPWGNDVMHFYNLINEKYNDCSFYISDNVGLKEIRSIHICTFKSAKGLEFDSVIIPNFHKAFLDLKMYNVTWKDYYVGLTRAKNNLYLISERDLPEIEEFVTIPTDEIQDQTNITFREEDDLPF